MINTNSKLLSISDAAFKLISALCDYGKRSHPKNEVLLKKCNLGTNAGKLKKAKKELIDKGFLKVENRFKKSECGRLVRDSNRYVITTKLISKYNGDSFQESNFEQLEFEQLEFEQFKNHQVENHLFENQHDENAPEYKLLKLITIKTYKLLKTYIYSLKEEKKEAEQEIEKLKAENIALKAKLQKEKKVAPKKESAPDIPPMPGFTPKHENQANAPSKKYQQELQGFQFPAHWSKELIDAFMDYCDSMDFKKAGKWGTMRQLQSEINQIESNLVKHEMKLVAGAIKFAADKGNTTYNIEWHKNRMKNEKPTNRKETSANSANSADGNIFDAFEKGFSSGGDSFGQSETDFEIPIQEY